MSPPPASSEPEADAEPAPDATAPDANASAAPETVASDLDAVAPDDDVADLDDRALDPDRRRALRTAERIVTFAIVAACVVYVLWQQRPDLLLRNTTPNGGDMGAHVWWPAYVRDHLIPHFRVAGWAPDWYAGFPVGQFYFPLPALAIIALDVVLPYNVAFKLVTAAGPLLLPIAAYAFIRSIRAPRIAAPLASIASVVLIFFKGDPRLSSDSKTAAFDQHIMGLTLASNLAGEFSFGIAVALGLFALAALARALDGRVGRNGKRANFALPAALVAATVLSHLVVGIFVAVGALIIWVAYRPVVNLRVVVAIAAVAGALTAFWSLPLVATLRYTTNMNYERLDKYALFLFPRYFWWVFALGAVAVVIGIVRMRRATFIVLAMTVAFAFVFRFWPQSHAWNLRFLPFWYLGLFLLAALGAAEILGALATGVTRILPRRRVRATPLVAVGLVAVTALVALVRVQQTRGFLPFWAQWNYSGYQQTTGKAAKAYTEFRTLIETMDALPPGRAMWEGGSSIDRYGTPLALELLPYFTHGRIDSMEGLYFESSATTPYHFVAVSALSGPGNASNPVRGLEYKSISDFRLGVQYLRVLGVRYYMAYSTEAKAAADADRSDLRRVATVPDLDNTAPLGWSIYEVRDAPLVQGLAYQPVVATNATRGTTAQCYGNAAQPGTTPVHLDPWECLAAGWFDNATNLKRPLAADGPSSWQRAPAAVADGTALGRPLPHVTVSDVHTTDSSVRFHVSRTGVPVVVKASYFPNWKASGASGPWRLTPNLMVVVPTSHDVSLDYTRTGVEWLGIVVTLLGLAGLVALARWHPAPTVPAFVARLRRRPREPDDDGGGPAGDATDPDKLGETGETSSTGWVH